MCANSRPDCTLPYPKTMSFGKACHMICLPGNSIANSFPWISVGLLFSIVASDIARGYDDDDDVGMVVLVMAGAVVAMDKLWLCGDADGLRSVFPILE